MFGALRNLTDLAVTEHLVVGLLHRAMQLRANATLYDALYVALAEQLGCSVVTTDVKLAAIPGVNCPIEVFA